MKETSSLCILQSNCQIKQDKMSVWTRQKSRGGLVRLKISKQKHYRTGRSKEAQSKPWNKITTKKASLIGTMLQKWKGKKILSRHTTLRSSQPLDQLYERRFKEVYIRKWKIITNPNAWERLRALRASEQQPAGSKPNQMQALCFPTNI